MAVRRAGASAASRAMQGLGRSVRRRGWVHHEQCCLTLRSSRLAPAWHLAREAVWFIIRLAGQAPYRRSPLSSNVRPHANRRMTSRACGRGGQDQMQSQSRLRSPEGSLRATRGQARSAISDSSLERSELSSNMSRVAVRLRATEGAGRPSAGGQLTARCARQNNSMARSCSAHAQSLVRARRR